MQSNGKKTTIPNVLSDFLDYFLNLFCTLFVIKNLQIKNFSKILITDILAVKFRLYIIYRYIGNGKVFRGVRGVRGVRGRMQNAKPTLRSESRGCLHTLPSREEEKPSKRG